MDLFCATWLAIFYLCLFPFSCPFLEGLGGHSLTKVVSWQESESVIGEYYVSDIYGLEVMVEDSALKSGQGQLINGAYVAEPS